MKRNLIIGFILLLALGGASTVQAFPDFGGFFENVRNKFWGGADEQNVQEPPGVVIASEQAKESEQALMQAQARKQENLAKKAGLLGRIALIGKDKACTNAGGFWFWTENRVGCVGVDATAGCDNRLVRMAQTKCEDSGAKFVCNDNGLYCTY